MSLIKIQGYIPGSKNKVQNNGVSSRENVLYGIIPAIEM